MLTTLGEVVGHHLQKYQREGRGFYQIVEDRDGPLTEFEVRFPGHFFIKIADTDPVCQVTPLHFFARTG